MSAQMVHLSELRRTDLAASSTPMLLLSDTQGGELTVPGWVLADPALKQVLAVVLARPVTLLARVLLPA